MAGAGLATCVQQQQPFTWNTSDPSAAADPGTYGRSLTRHQLRAALRYCFTPNKATMFSRVSCDDATAGLATVAVVVLEAASRQQKCRCHMWWQLW